MARTALQELAIAVSFDISALFRNAWLQPLLTQLVSTSEKVRGDATAAFAALASRTCQSTQENLVMEIVAEMLTRLTTGKCCVVRTIRLHPLN